ncbi:hypothetical protein BDZ97DRAFT_1837962 [Flammula alnicola]|nr:hypothetical protein BDZ97DRAFT_1837962 [Flammula alnicola]
MARTMASTIVEPRAQITAETAPFNELRFSGALLDESRKMLSELKKALAMAGKTLLLQAPTWIRPRRVRHRRKRSGFC